MRLTSFLRAPLACLLTFAATAIAVEPLPRGYKQFEWGMTKTQVQKLDSGAAQDRGDLKSTGKVGRYPVDVSYEFHKAGLSAVGLTLRVTETGRSASQLYRELRDQLVAKYGEPFQTSPPELKDREMTVWCPATTSDGGTPRCDQSSSTTTILLSWRKKAAVDSGGTVEQPHVLVLYMSKAAFERAAAENAAEKRELSDDL